MELIICWSTFLNQNDNFLVFEKKMSNLLEVLFRFYLIQAKCY